MRAKEEFMKPIRVPELGDVGTNAEIFAPPRSLKDD
jgi:hypothetical protein